MQEVVLMGNKLSLESYLWELIHHITYFMGFSVPYTVHSIITDRGLYFNQYEAIKYLNQIIYKLMVPAERFELPTFGLQNRYTSTVLRRINLLSPSMPV